MLIEVAIAIISLTLALLVTGLVILFLKLQKTLDKLQSDIHRVSFEVSDLIGKVSNLTGDILDKSESLNFLFPSLPKKPATEKEPAAHTISIPQVVGWLISSVFLVKKTKEFMKCL